MKNVAENKILDGPDVEVGNKLTDAQLAEIKKYLPRDYAMKFAKKYDGIDKRQTIEVFNQRSSNPKWNEIVWTAVIKKLSENNRQDLVEAVEKRLSFCKALLDI